jgi:hypothetical protein
METDLPGTKLRSRGKKLGRKRNNVDRYDMSVFGMLDVHKSIKEDKRNMGGVKRKRENGGAARGCGHGKRIERVDEGEADKGKEKKREAKYSSRQGEKT